MENMENAIVRANDDFDPLPLIAHGIDEGLHGVGQIIILVRPRHGGIDIRIFANEANEEVFGSPTKQNARRVKLGPGRKPRIVRAIDGEGKRIAARRFLPRRITQVGRNERFQLKIRKRPRLGRIPRSFRRGALPGEKHQRHQCGRNTERLFCSLRQGIH